MTLRTDRRVLATAALTAVLAAGCGPDASMGVSLVPAHRYEGVTLTVADRLGVRSFSDSTLRAGPLALEAGPFGVASRGSLRVRVRLRRGGRTVARGGVRLEAREAYRWSVRLFYGERDPLPVCMDCFGSRRIRLAEEARAAPGEALWIVWGGRPVDRALEP